jgi:hypothetical protein
MQMAVLLLLFRSHLGNESDLCSLSRWIKELDRNGNKFWDKTDAQVKNFNACLDFFDIVLDGYILSAVASICDYNSLESFTRDFGNIDLGDMINRLAEVIVKFTIVDANRRKGIGDSAHDNFLLFLQHGVIFRNFNNAIRKGDPGLCLTSLSYFTVWFQGSRQHNYAAETMQLCACLKRCWSPTLKQFYLENSLINLSGKANGWVSCDAMNERVVREVKAMRVSTSNPAVDEHWRNMVALQTMLLPEVKEKMAEECGVWIFDHHSSPVEKMTDVRAIASVILRDRTCVQIPQRDRDVKETMSTDLFSWGQRSLASTKKIVDFKKRVLSGGWMGDEEMDDDRLAVVQNDSETVTFWSGDLESSNEELDDLEC